MADIENSVAPPASAETGRDREVVFLTASAFLASVSFGIESAAAPFLAQDFGARSSGVGALGAVGSVTYSGLLFVLLMYFGRVWDRHCPRRMSMTAQLYLAVGSVAFMTAGAMPMLYGVALAKGVAAASFWPPLMAWFSAGREGSALNRRLSYFNLSWCSGLIIGPALGGELYEIWPQLPFAAAAWCQAAGAGALWRSKPPVGTDKTPVSETAPATGGDGVPDWKRHTFRRVALVSHFTAYLVMGLARYQFPVLATSIGIRPSVFGWVMMTLSLFMTGMFWLLGRSRGWHFRFGYLLLAQAGLVLAMLGASRADGAAALAVVTASCGICIGFTYTSNLFYGASGDSRRGRRMAIHEFLIGVGFGVGGLLGGLANDRFGLRTAYPLCAIAIAVGATVQIFILAALRTRNSGSVIPASRRPENERPD
ncbi:MAG TPA: MFS transporter [Candidatus Brocadiia bacterium]|nr:MFS transporter [Candidatus Brocadiia bacterium]